MLIYWIFFCRMSSKGDIWKNWFVDHFFIIAAKSSEILSAKNLGVIKYHLKKRIKLFQSILMLLLVCPPFDSLPKYKTFVKIVTLSVFLIYYIFKFEVFRKNIMILKCEWYLIVLEWRQKVEFCFLILPSIN